MGPFCILLWTDLNHWQRHESHQTLDVSIPQTVCTHTHRQRDEGVEVEGIRSSSTGLGMNGVQAQLISYKKKCHDQLFQLTGV